MAVMFSKSVSETGQIVSDGRTIDFTIVRKPRRKRSFALSLGDDNMLRILVPLRAKKSVIEEIVRDKADWILRRIEIVRQTRLSAPRRRFEEGEAVSYLGKNYKLQIVTASAQACRLKPRRMEVCLLDSSLSTTARREEVRLEILLWLKKRARMKLQKRLDFWAEKIGVRYSKLVINSPDHRWGSCNAQNVIRLNWRLIMAPLPLIDYVVAHELCHVAQKNHGPRFWRLMENIMPDCKARQKQLRKIGATLVL